MGAAECEMQSVGGAGREGYSYIAAFTESILTANVGYHRFQKRLELAEVNILHGHNIRRSAVSKVPYMHSVLVSKPLRIEFTDSRGGQFLHPAPISHLRDSRVRETTVYSLCRYSASTY